MRIIPAATVVVLIAAASPAVTSVRASDFASFDRKLQVDHSDLVLTGSVTSVTSSWSPDHSVIYTDAELAIDDVWKGFPDRDRIVVRSLGGRVGRVGLEVDGAAPFAVGERVLVFLKQTGAVFTPVGMKFGRYEVRGHGADLFAVGSPPPAAREAQPYETVSVPLEELRKDVAALVAGGAR
jgi:hypothetical protein